MPTAIAIGGAIAIKKLIDQITADLYASFKDGYKDKLERISALNNISALSNKIEEVGRVKTIWQTDKSIQLSSFYCQSHVLLNGERRVVNSVSDFEIDGNILIEGIAGQGKSILMRHLCMTELDNGNFIPVFIELRRINSEQELMPIINAKLVELGFDIDPEIFRYLCSLEKMLFLLDGFDEVPDKIQKSLINEIEDITNLYRGIKIVVSSRPESGIEYLPSFSVAKVDYVRNDEYKVIISKLSESAEFAETLIDRINVHKSDIKEMLCTPLMITLLVLTYKAYQKIPEQLSEFFESMFHLMLQRHDGTKPGYTRERRCTLNDIEYQRIFEALCFLSKDNGQTFKASTLYECAARAISICKLDADPQKYVQDINRITCLIVYEGKVFRFLHKSIQEYFAASFIKYKPDSVSVKFYDKMDLDSHKWHQELLYLEEIDKYRFSKYLLLPACRKYLNPPKKTIPKKIITKDYSNILEKTFYFTLEPTSWIWFGYDRLLRSILETSELRVTSRSILANYLQRNKIFNDSKDLIHQYLNDFQPKTSTRWVSLKKLRDNNICFEAITLFAEAVFDLLHRRGLDCQKYLKEQEKTDFMEDFL
ncbi:hypothetical protein GMLC_22630 [Geomonas limicola]|uniref:NACHT domain-containing protein n=1 Tax=Geomonas limicola TaxID=2740186 RepID=A0A6V8N9W9_9BACT|nr:NACHT domain-containing protein [Geomonas limicola]GFO68684.1 hypothetical protein GMLC_22630 [Geomonas limicola]